MEWIKSDKGEDKLLLDGHSYTHHRKNVNSIRYQCVMRNAYKCWAGVSLNLTKNQVVHISKNGHNHEADAEYIEGKKVRDKMKTAQDMTRGKPCQIVTDALSKCSVAVIKAAGSTTAHKQCLMSRTSTRATI